MSLKNLKEVLEYKWIKTNIYKPGTVKYYKDQLNTIVLVAQDYDGYNPNSAKQMRELVDELKSMALSALKHKKLYLKLKENKNG